MGWLWEGLRRMFCTTSKHAQGDASKLHRSEVRADDAVTSSIEASKVHWSELPVDPTNSETLAESELRADDSVTSSIEASKVHWSELPVDPTNSELLEELEIQEGNRTSWKALQQLNPFFFQDWNEKVNVGQLIAEGGQAKIYEATWKDEQYSHLSESKDMPEEIVVKVFKLEGCSLEKFSTQWPRVSSISNTVLHGQSRSELNMKIKSLSDQSFVCPSSNVASYSSFHKPQYICPIVGAYVLKENRFAFLMQRYSCDLRSLIDRKMRDNGGHGPPLPAEQARVLRCIAKGMAWLHSHGVLHRDLKSSNVLVLEKGKYWREYAVSDYECSLSTIGTGFWRAPEVLQELRDRSGRKHDDIWTMKSDVYSFGVLCFEVLTGGIPFAEFSSKKDWDEIIDRNIRPMFPDYVDPKLQEMVKRCWDRDPLERPRFRNLSRELESYENETQRGNRRLE